MRNITAILDAITQTEDWNRLQSSPLVSEANEKLLEELHKLPDYEDVAAAAYQYATACERAAILYGVHLADTLRSAAADPAAYLIPTEE